MELLSYTTFDHIVFVKWKSCVNFGKIFGIKINFGAYVTIQTSPQI